MEFADQYDVIVIGGGPAGSTTAALTAEAGLRVVVFEREEFPRFRIGESLMPATYWTLDRLGMLDKMKQTAFPNKQSVQFFSADGRAGEPYYFPEFDRHESSTTWQVVRSEFDQMLLDNAAAKGAEVIHKVNVRDVLFEDSRAIGVHVSGPDGQPARYGAKITVDATGQNALLARKLKLRTTDTNLLHAAFFTQYEGAERAQGRDAGGTLVMHTAREKSWFWYIPLPRDRVSVGVVGPIDHLVRRRSRDPQKVFDEELAQCTALQRLLAPGHQAQAVRVVKDFSYCAEKIAGDGWVLVGDAFGFIDPVYSSGVFLALKSGEYAADSIIAACACGDFSAARLGNYQQEFVTGLEALRKMVYAFYSRDFRFGQFLSDHPQCKDDLVNLLIGNVYRRSTHGLMESMDEFCELPAYTPLHDVDPQARGSEGGHG